MRVKRFVGDNVTDTISKVKKELGPEAIILQTRQFKEGGFLGLFAKTKFEITAAIEYEQPEKIIQQPVRENYSHSEVTEFKAEFKQELHKLHTMLANMGKHIQDLEPKNATWPTPLLKWVNTLEKAGFNEKMIQSLLGEIQQNLNGEEQCDDLLVQSLVEKTVKQHCSKTGAIQPGFGKPNIIALIGPTGVGKTTTIGKLAAGFGIVDKRKVALVTIDTFRVAAVEQLKTFGQIIGVPVEVAMTPSGLAETLNRHSDKEIIFIDTAGRSPQHQLHLQELRAFMEAAKPDYTILVISATTQFNDQRKILTEFQPLATNLIITKLDETISSGSILNLLDFTSLPVAYITNGQNVPNDIEAATAESLSRYVLREVRING